MLNGLELFFNSYDRRARLYPVLLAALPILVSTALLFPDFGLTWAAVGGLALYCGVTAFLTQVGRDAGKSLEPTLFQSWGGKPSVVMLRHSDNYLNPLTKGRYRRFLEEAVPNLKLASEAEENKCLQEADDSYESATAWLLAQTRDRSKFDLLFRENINYGFRRNILALKVWALVFDGIALFIIAVLNFNFRTGDAIAVVQSVDTPILACVMLTTVHALFFVFLIRRKWVRIAAEEYAQRLLSACDILMFERKA